MIWVDDKKDFGRSSAKSKNVVFKTEVNNEGFD